MALAKQIIRLHATYANLIAVAGDNELQLYMIGIATDTDEFIFRSDDGYHRCLDSGTTALSEHSIPFINSSGKVVQDNTNLQFNNGTDTLTTKILTTLNDINAAEYIKRSGVNDDYIRFENDKITIAAGGNTVATFEDDAITFSKVFSAITGSTIGTLTLADGSITDSSGAISFGNENLSTTGTLSAGAITSTSLTTNTGAIDSKTTYAIDGTTVFTIAGTSNILLGNCGANYTGSYGVAIGAGSMGSTGAGTSGSYNFALGYNCLTNCTSGNQNIGIGAQCFNALNIGIFNCSIGTNSSLSMTSARYNTAVGFQALYTVLTEWGNVGIGLNAGRYYRGEYSVLIGYEAGRGGAGATYTGANYNVCIGWGAGWSMVTNQDSCIFLGNKSGYYETADSTLMIDNQARTNEATHRLGAMIYGLFNATPTSQELRFNASIYIKEGPAGGNTDYAGYGQLQCRDNAGTTELWFINDAGGETQLV